MAKEKKEEKRESPIPVKKDVTPSTREIKKNLLYNNTVNLTTIEYNSEVKTSNAKLKDQHRKKLLNQMIGQQHMDYRSPKISAAKK
ncbi:hypothetical protein TNCV_3268481 [Trichonephila clavipes]|nr:hypothetical protein TNCV_3268481 [Trichonephila clavipes]